MARRTGSATVLTAWTGTLLRALDARGLDGPALAASVGVAAGALDDPDRRIPLEQSSRLWRAAVEAVGDDAFGIEVSRQARPGSFHALGHAFVSSPTLGTALDRAARFSRITSDVAQASTATAGPEFTFTVGWRDPAERASWESLDAVLATIVRAARYLLGREVGPTRLDLARPQPSNVARFESFFHCPVRFGAELTALSFDRAVAERPIPGGSERIASVSEQAIQDHLARFVPATVAEEVRAVVVDALVMGEPDVGAVARELAMSPRSLQRRLAEEGTSFRAVLAEARCDLADALLDSGESVTATALRLGFSETAAFSRAYRRWTGRSPSRRASAPNEHPPRSRAQRPRSG